MHKFYEELMENDLNPFIYYDSRGSLVKYNKEAEFLLSFVSVKDIYDLVLSHAPISFGFKKTYISLQYGRLSFYAILVGYIDEEHIGIRLYKEVFDSSEMILDKDMQVVNLFTILKLSENSSLPFESVKITEVFDPSIPELKVKVDKFLKLLNSIFYKFQTVQDLEIKVYFKLGETIIINKKRYPIVCITFKSLNFSLKSEDILPIAKEASVSLYSSTDWIRIELPLILD
jgi:hypothetical protein